MLKGRRGKKREGAFVDSPPSPLPLAFYAVVLRPRLLTWGCDNRRDHPRLSPVVLRQGVVPIAIWGEAMSPRPAD